MAMQLTCGQCGGLLMVEQTGVVVLCPHCSAQLSIPAMDEPATTSQPEPPAPQQTEAAAPDETPSAPAEPEAAETAQAPDDSAPPADQPPADVADFSFLGQTEQPAVDEGSFNFSEPVADSIPETPAAAEPPESPKPPAAKPKKQRPAKPVREPESDSVSNAKDDTINESDFSFLGAAEAGGGMDFSTVSDAAPVVDSGPAPKVDAQPVASAKKPVKKKKPKPKSPTPTPRKAADTAPSEPPESPTGEIPADAVSKRTFFMLAGYAAAVTLALLYFLLSGGSSALESLPDLEPLQTGEYRHVPADVDLPPHHDLRLGEERQFGSVIVRPVKVTREMVEFVHFENDSVTPLTPDGPALKLWLEFEHTGDCDSFAPWDLNLMTKRAERAKSPGEILANSFLCRADDLKSRNDVVLNYFHSADSEWNLKDQNAGQRLSAEQTMKTYIVCDPSTYGAVIKNADSLIWRIQFRKGVSPQGNGVTTLVDVHFSADDIAS